jgi:hypothetical protein
LILTLTIDAFDPQNGVAGAFRVAGDYSAVFPLLTVAVFIALQISRQTIFYEKQRSRGDIMALPEVLCEPGKEGRPLVMDYDGKLHELDESDYEYESEGEGNSIDVTPVGGATNDGGTTQSDIEAHFDAQVQEMGWVEAPSGVSSTKVAKSPLPPRPREMTLPRSPLLQYHDPANQMVEPMNNLVNGSVDSTLNELLDTHPSHLGPSAQKKAHRRTRSEPFYDAINTTTVRGLGNSSRERNGSGSVVPLNLAKVPVPLKRVSSFGQVDQEQPSLLDQARKRAASFTSAEKTKTTQSRGVPLASGSPKIVNRKVSM